MRLRRCHTITFSVIFFRRFSENRRQPGCGLSHTNGVSSDTFRRHQGSLVGTDRSFQAFFLITLVCVVPEAPMASYKELF